MSRLSGGTGGRRQCGEDTAPIIDQTDHNGVGHTESTIQVRVIGHWTPSMLASSLAEILGQPSVIAHRRTCGTRQCGIERRRDTVPMRNSDYLAVEEVGSTLPVFRASDCHVELLAPTMMYRRSRLIRARVCLPIGRGSDQVVVALAPQSYDDNGGFKDRIGFAEMICAPTGRAQQLTMHHLLGRRFSMSMATKPGAKHFSGCMH